MTTRELTNSIEANAKSFIMESIQKFQVYGFWCILMIGIGIWCGITYCNKTRSNDMEKSIQLGGLIYKDVVYDIHKR